MNFRRKIVAIKTYDTNKKFREILKDILNFNKKISEKRKIH